VDSIKLPPSDSDAEEAVIGSLLIDGESINSLRDLAADDFYYEPNRWLFLAALSLKEKGVSINQVTLARELSEQDRLEACGGAARLSYLVSICPTSLDIGHYAGIVHRLSLYRQLIAAGDLIASIGYDGKSDIGESLERADSLILSLRQNVGGTHIITPRQRMDRAMDRYILLHEKEAGVAISTGIKDLDKKLGGGLYSGEVTILAGRTSMGKTAMLQCIANNVSLSMPVLFCSGEMSIDSLIDRDMAGLAGMSVDDIRLGGYDEETFTQILAKIPEMEQNQVYHMESGRGFYLTTSSIYQLGYELKIRQGLGLIVVDYLGLMADTKGQNENERLGHITRKLKQIAKELEVPLLVAHQLNRSLEARQDKRPQLYDLRESGHIEEDADDVLFIYRENYYNKDTTNNATEILIAKHRQDGSKAGKKVPLHWDAKAQTYRGMAKEEVING